MMKNLEMIKRLLGIMTVLIIPLSAQPGGEKPNTHIDNVKDFGATGKGSIFDTEAIQAAIDHINKSGGGTLYFPAGKYLIKPIRLKSNVRLYLDNGSEILGSKNPKDYENILGGFEDSGGQVFGSALIFASGAENIAIEGNGTINGQGFAEYFPKKPGSIRPYIIRFIECRRIKIKDIKLINSAAWVQHYVACQDLEITGIRVKSYSNKNNDGINIQGCERVLIDKCNVDTEDDSIVLKALTTRPVKDVVISNCIISGLKSAIKTGTESIGGFENITITNCTIYGTRGISLLAVDGGTLNNVTISNISMRDTYAVIVMRLGDRMRPYSVPEEERPKSPGEFKNVMISNIQAINVTESNDFISGIPGHHIENITFDNIRIEYNGGGTKKDFKRNIPELTGEYPKARMFGKLPSYGFFIRHAKNVSLRNIDIHYKNEDHRPAIYCDDVKGIRLSSLNMESSADAPLIYFNDVDTGIIDDVFPDENSSNLLKARGNKTRNILLSGIVKDGWEDIVKIDESVSGEEIHYLEN